jgi:AraC family transcriptional regulator
MKDSLQPEQQLSVRICPTEFVERKTTEWPGVRAEFVTATQRRQFKWKFKSTHHLLIAIERSERISGETSVNGLPPSTRRNASGSLTLVPAGFEFSGWQEPRVLSRVSLFYIDPNGALFDPELRFPDVVLQPRLFFFDPDLWRIATKLKEVGMNAGCPTGYSGALIAQLGYELVRLNRKPDRGHVLARGGLSGWQQKKVADYIEEHLSKELPLSELAALVDLSPFHFSRAFKQSFGAPPHRYHINRRMERAKTLLAAERSVTEVALAIGFAETSSFSAAFRKTTGFAPSAFRRAAI